MSDAVFESTPTLLIRPTTGWAGLRLGEVWRYRELLAFLAWRDISVRYKQTALGVAWAVLQPVATVLVFTLVFSGMTASADIAAPYPLFALCGLVPWQLFAYAVSQSSQSLVNSERLLTKVYFPRLVIPIASVGAGLADFGVAALAVVIAMVVYGAAPGWSAVAAPLFIAQAVAAALGVGLWLSALNVQYRDVRFVVPFLTQFWLFATPVAYPSTVIAEPWRAVLALNPMAGAVEGLRWTLLGGPAPDPLWLALSATITVTVLVGGLVYFRHMERGFADRV